VTHRDREAEDVYRWAHDFLRDHGWSPVSGLEVVTPGWARDDGTPGIVTMAAALEEAVGRLEELAEERRRP
jgi:hypothetical protein